MATNFESGFSTTLALPLAVADTTMTVATAPTVTSGRIKIGIGTIKEWVTFSWVSGTTLTGLTRWLSKTADPATAGTGLAWIAWTKVKIVAMHDQIVDKTASNTYSAGTTQTFPDIAFSGTTTGGLKVKSLTTTQRDALVAPANGMIIYNTTTLVNNQYIGWAWADFATGATPAASTTVAGKVQKSTPTQVTNGTSTGSTGAELFVWPAELKTVTDAIISWNVFWWNASDWVIDWTSNVTITWSNGTYIIKNYASIVAGTAPRVFTITPTWCVLHIKVKWNSDFSNWTFSFQWKWWQGGAWSTWWAAATAGSPFTQILQKVTTWGSESAWGAWNWADWSWSWAWVKGNIFWLDTIKWRRYIEIWWWSWGWGWSWLLSTIWWTGGNWWGCVIIEVLWNVTLDNSTTIINLSWSNWMNAIGSPWLGNGWWGWGGGSFYLMYWWSLTWTCTPNITAGTGWAWINWWSTWWAGWVWLSLIEKNVVF